MNQIIPATFRDANGAEEITIELGAGLGTTTIRGLHLETDFFSFEPMNEEEARNHPSHSTFLWDELGDICAYTLDFDLPVAVILDEKEMTATFKIHVRVGPPTRQWNSAVQVELKCGAFVAATPFIEDGIETALLHLKTLLPPNMIIKTCFFCAFSDYSPYGFGPFGDMRCHRDAKEQYLAVRSKEDYWNVPLTEDVNEFYLCPEFEKRVPGTGYRG